jgi:solute carrier family 9B (sodium/hydrogen exchanger), member 1/2
MIKFKRCVNFIMFRYVLAATSPAVIAPVMINFQENDRGTDKGVPTMVLVASSTDNLYCVTAFYMASSIVFTTAGINMSLCGVR